MKAFLRALSGLGEKGPACFLLVVEGARLLIDAGKGPDAGKVPPLERLRELDRLDGVVLSHAHPDHAGALDLVLSALGKPAREVPVFGTYSTLKALNIRKGVELPERGTAEIRGIPVETGRAGHAPGGMWVRFGIGKGFLYMGDSCASSAIFAYDPPPPSRFVLFDASYELYDSPSTLEDPFWKESLDNGGRGFDGGLVLPVPADGRGVELTYLLAGREEIDPTSLRIDTAVRDAVRRCGREDAPYLRIGVAPILESLADTVRASSVKDPRGVHLVSNGEASEGMAAAWVAAWEREKRPAFVFTGYLGKGTPARRMVESGRALWRRWNVHPTLSETIALLQSTGAEEGVPCFTEEPELFRSVERLSRVLFHCERGKGIPFSV